MYKLFYMNMFIYNKLKPIRNLIRRYLGLDNKIYQEYNNLNIKQIAGELARINRIFNNAQTTIELRPSIKKLNEQGLYTI